MKTKLLHKKKIYFILLISLCTLILPRITFSQDIFTAIMQGDLEKTKSLIETDASLVSKKNPRGFAPIHFAANFKQFEIAKLLVENGANPFETGAFNRQPIHWAAAGGSLDILKWLEKLEADLNIKDETDKTPLYLAATRGHKEIVKYLLSKEAEIETNSEGAFELFYFSITQGHEGIVSKFLNSDFNFGKTSDDGTNLMMAAALAGHSELIKELADKGINLNHQNDFGECALHIAIQNNHFDAMKQLLNLGANINIKDFSGQNALTFAEKLYSDESANFLKSKGLEASKRIKPEGNYPDFSEPGLTPKLLAPGIISLPNRNERDVMFSPDMKEFYFSRHWAANRMQMTVQKMIYDNQKWSLPETANFSGKYSDAECFITPDNKNLYLISKRPYDGTDHPAPWEIWVAERVQDDWDNFRLFDTVNLKGCFYPSLNKKGELLYTTAKNILMLATLKNGKVENTKQLSSKINGKGGGYNAMIAPNGEYIIFTSHGFEDHYGGGDLYISFRKEDESWSQALNMGPEINTASTEYCPNVSPDEKYFFFTSNKKGTEDIYWVDAKIIEKLRHEVLNN